MTDMEIITLLFLTPTFILLAYLGVANLIWGSGEPKPKFITPAQLVEAHQRRVEAARLRMYKTMDRMDEWQ